MPIQTFKRWTRGRYYQAKNLAQKHRRDVIASKLGRSPFAAAIEAHQLGLSLKMPAKRAEYPDEEAS
jgi:hypothetical protein